MSGTSKILSLSAAVFLDGALTASSAPAGASERSYPIEITVPAGTGGGAVAVQRVGNHVDATVNNPIEAVAHWRASKLRPLCVFDSKKLDYHDKIADNMSWNDIPTCKSQGVDIEYLMLRGYFMPPGVSRDEVAYYVDMFKKVRETPEWKKLTSDGGLPCQSQLDCGTI